MSITQISRSLNLSSLSNYYLNHPVNKGMADGYWYYYSSSAANNTLGTKIKPYRWDTPLDTNEVGDILTIDGTIQLVSESLKRPRVFHGSGLIREGAGTSTQLGITVDDSFFFYHLGDLRAADNIGYWDYAYLQNGGSEWTYFQYHQHNPNIYEDSYDERGIQYANQWLNETDKSFGHIQQTAVSVMGTTYTNIMARVHTPSAGFAHNSHFDQELPATKAQNYMMGGLIKGTSDRYHAFYISPNGSQWNVYSRTFILASQGWTAESIHGTYDLADPTFLSGATPNTQMGLYPFRASCGALVGSFVHVPVVHNNPTSGYDLKVWQFESGNSILTSTITTQSIVTGVSERPDCQMVVIGTTIFAVVSDVTNGGVDLYKHLDNTTSWSFVDNVVTNGNQDIIRIHGFGYNTTDTQFYTLLSGDVTGSGGTYSGSGVYKFTEGTPFNGYSHLSYLTSSYGFQTKGPLESGYLRYLNVDGSLSFKSGSEPAGISETERILIYDEASPKFYEKNDTKLGGDEYYYAGTRLNDGRLVGVGVIDNNIESRGGKDLVVAMYDTTGEHPEFYGTGGSGDDYFTGVIEDVQNRNLWMVGYTKSYLAEKRDIKVHAFGRGFIDGANKLEWRDVKIDSFGNQYFIGNHQENSGSLVAMYDYNFNNKWIIELNSTSHTEGYGITLDSNRNVYVVGRTNDGGAGGYDAYVTKLNNSGSLQWSKYFGATGNQYASSVETLIKSSTEHIVSTIVSGTTTIINVLDTNGNVVEQKQLTGFTANRIRKSDSESGDYFLLAGKDTSSPSKAAFAKGQIQPSGEMFKWIRTYSSGSLASEAFDIRNTEQSTGNGGLGSLTGPAYHVVGSEGTNGFILKFFMDESAGTFQSTKTWGKNVSGSVLYTLTNTDYTTTPSGSRYTYAAGYSSVSPEGQGGEEGLFVSFDYTGSRVWTTTLGHTNNERVLSIERDITGNNIISAGWSESHSNGRRTLNFRTVNTGYGTGNYHEASAPGMAMWYYSSSLSVSTNNATISSVTPPTNTSPSFTSTSGSLTGSTSLYSEEYYDGGNLFDFFICKMDLEAVAAYKNTPEHKELDEECANVLKYNDDLFTFYQIGSGGDGTADDGNFFGYDILKLSGSNVLAMVGQTSADITKYNLGSSGVYDYTLVEFDLISGSFIEIYQNGTSFDEEIYALTEMNDGSGSVAFVGRTTGNIGGSPAVGTYDILLGIYNGVTEQFTYFQTGSGNIDKAVNVHDVGNNQLAVVFETADVITTGATNFGGLDVGVMLFNYSSSLWSTSSYQVGSTEDEILGQEGKHSVYLESSNRIAICGKTLGTFGDESVSYGVNDMFLAIFDINKKTWTKYQVGTQANENGTTIFNLGGDRLVVGGYTDASFEEPNNGIFVTFDAAIGPKGKSSI
jgi:hypothetical protein